MPKRIAYPSSMVRAPAHCGRRLFAAGAAALLAVALSGTALAGPPPSIELDWTAPPGCPERGAVLAEAEQLLAMSSGRGGIAAVEAKAAITRQGAGWALDLEILSSAGPGRRHFQDESCQRLAQVAALALALAVHPPAPARPARVLEGSERRAQAPAARYLARALLSGDFGSLRAPGPGPRVAFGLFLGRGRAEATLGYWSAISVEGARDQLLSGGLRACTGLLEHPELDLCLEAELGGLRAGASRGSRSASGTWLALLAGPALGFELASWLAVRLEVDLGAALLRPAFPASGSESPGASANFGRVAAGLEARF